MARIESTNMNESFVYDRSAEQFKIKLTMFVIMLINIMINIAAFVVLKGCSEAGNGKLCNLDQDFGFDTLG